MQDFPLKPNLFEIQADDVQCVRHYLIAIPGVKMEGIKKPLIIRRRWVSVAYLRRASKANKKSPHKTEIFYL